MYRQNFVLFLGISGIPRLLSLAVGLLGISVSSTPGHVGIIGGTTTVGLTLIGLLVGMVVYLLAQGGTVVAVNEIYLGRSTSVTASLQRAWSEALPLFGVVFLNGLAIGAASIALVIPGIWVACRLLVCIPAALIEGRGPSNSLSRSWDLTKGFALRSLVIYLLYFVIALGVGSLLLFPVSFLIGLATKSGDFGLVRIYLALDQVLSAAFEVLVTPIFLIAASIFYFDLRVRKEAFDLQFMMDPNSERSARGGDSVPTILS